MDTPNTTFPLRLREIPFDPLSERDTDGHDVNLVSAPASAECAIELHWCLETLERDLPEAELEAFVLRDLLGYSVAESAEKTGRSASAIKMATTRARRRLQLRWPATPAMDLSSRCR